MGDRLRGKVAIVIGAGTLPDLRGVLQPEKCRQAGRKKVAGEESPGSMFGLYACLINLNKWNGLPTEAQRLLLAAGKETQEWDRKEVQKVDGEALAELKKHGMEIYYTSSTATSAAGEKWRLAMWRSEGANRTGQEVRHDQQDRQDAENPNQVNPANPV